MVDVNKTMPPMGGWGEITALPRPVADSPVADRVGSYRAFEMGWAMMGGR